MRGVGEATGNGVGKQELVAGTKHGETVHCVGLDPSEKQSTLLKDSSFFNLYLKLCLALHKNYTLYASLRASLKD